AEPAAEIETAYGRWQQVLPLQRLLVALALRLDDRRVAQVLRAGEHVEAFEAEVRGRDLAQQSGHLLGIHAELARAPAHLHAGRLELERQVHAHRDPWADAQALTGTGKEAHLPERFEVDQDAGSHR